MEEAEKKKLLDWMKDYVGERQMITNINIVNTSWCKISGGVPQGSILGPIMFIIYKYLQIMPSNLKQ